MRLVIDANILVAELIRQRGRELILHLTIPKMARKLKVPTINVYA